MSGGGKARPVTFVALAAVVAVATLAACRDEVRRANVQGVAAPVTQATAIPDAPVNGTIHGAPFTVRDARYVVDRRIGFVHTDLLLSAGRAETPCGPIVPAHATSVWLRLDGEILSGPQELRLEAGADAGAWSIHYQAFDGNAWMGVGEGSALVALRAAAPDGRLSGGLGVCFADDARSCVTGSFQAQSCPPSIDTPVRGALPTDPVPERFRLQMLDAGLRTDAAPARSPPHP